MYARDYRTIRHYVNKSGQPFWIRRVLLSDDEFLNDAQETIDLHRVAPRDFPLKKELRELILTYAKQASLAQFFVRSKR